MDNNRFEQIKFQQISHALMMLEQSRDQRQPLKCFINNRYCGYLTWFDMQRAFIKKRCRPVVRLSWFQVLKMTITGSLAYEKP